MTDGPNVPMTRHERKDALGHGGQTIVAARLGLRSPSLVSKVVNCEKTHVRNARVEREIAEYLGRPVEEVFPPRSIGQGAALQEDSLAA